MSVENIVAQVGQGGGTQVGHTDDGMVFLIVESRDPEGRPCQTISEMEPEMAKRVGTHLLDAVRAAEESKKLRKQANG